jgi:hypothetical protein
MRYRAGAYIARPYIMKKFLDIRIAHTLYPHQSDTNLTSPPILSLPPNLSPYTPLWEDVLGVGGRCLCLTFRYLTCAQALILG